MKTSSFIYGAIVGAAVYRMMAKRRGMSLISMIRNADLGQLANTAKDKMQNFTGDNNQGGSHRNGGNSGSSTRSASNQAGVQKSADTKAANLKQLKDFIRSNPEVKSEVEQILKETHTVIPGL